MKTPALILSLFLLINLTVSCQSKNKETKTETNKETGKDKEVIVAEFGKILDSLKVKGSILIYDLNKKTYYSNDFAWGKEGHIPASTFKIPNSIIALETGVVKSDSTVFKWNGEKRWMKAWEQDLTLKQAFRVSCVPCYQEIARKVGVKRMKAYLKKLDYNIMVFDTLTIDNFWLEGKSRISQFQQIDFLKRLYLSELPISKRTESIMKDIMEVEKTNDFVLRGKTGLSNTNEIKNGWFVGYLENKNRVYFFATNIEPSKETNQDDFIAIRLNATKAALKNLQKR
ncbi:class D beta-lactamase [Flavobacterium sp. AJR]|uniref:class D beta-lactamase n=1 Tax=Flavobacterium sp. AJR TaxID=1979369 RepID=UPI00057F1B80|nr:class D beta-lactamase [Flavobacterium sp. AJR]KIC02996.1 beta-lactamase [Flavobacterium sp. JRM]OUL61144.1 class D beta-lactamase [Flavobacterium sp. AJR]